MAFPIDPGRPPGIQPLENQVPNQGNVDLRAMLPLANAREQQHHDVIQHAGLGHGQHDDQDMNLEDMLPLRQAFNLDQDDAMLEDDNNQLREQVAPLAKHDDEFSLTKTLCQREAYKAITTTDDDVYNYIISIMEAIHKLPKNTKWESTKPKAQAINTNSSGVDSTPNKGKGKGKGKGKNKGPPLPNGKGKGGKGKGKGKSQSKSKASTPAPEGKGQSKGSTPGEKPAGGKPSGETVKRKPKQCVFYASPAGCIRGKSCPFLHQNDSVTKKPLPADPADVQRLKGKLQSVPKPANSAGTVTTPAAPASSSGATASTTPAPVLQLNMLRVDRHHLEPEPEPIRRHPVATWRPHDGPTSENHPKVLLTTAEAMRHVSLHMAGQHFEHIVFGANQYACWLRCSLCEKISPRIIYRYTICMKCPERRRDDHEPLWHMSTRCVLMKWNCLLLRLFWMGMEVTRAYFAHKLRHLRQDQRFVAIDDSEVMDIFHDTIELEHDMAQTLCDMRWAPLTRHAVLNEELSDSDLIPESGQPIGLAVLNRVVPDGNPREQLRNIHRMDDLRAEVSPSNTEQDATSLADRFSRGGLPITVGQLHGGITMEEESIYADALQSNEDELDETRNNEVHPRQASRQYDPYSTQGSCPSKPFEGLEQCLSWHQQAWNYMSHACPCHRRRCVNFQFKEPTQPRVVEGYASHRGYPILKPPHTTKQALTRVRDRVQDHEPYYGLDPHIGSTRIERTPGVPPYSAGTDMRSGGTTSNFDRISAMSHGVMNTGHTEYDTRHGHSSGVPSTYLASRPLLGRDGQDSEGLLGNRPRPVTRGTNENPTMHGTLDHRDSRRLADGLPVDLSGSPRTEAQGSHPGVDSSALGRQTDPGDRRTSDWRSSTWESHPMGLASTYGPSRAIERTTTGNASRILMTGLRRPGQRGVTASGSVGECHEIRNPTEHHNRWRWAELLQEEYPAEGYFMNTERSGTGTGSWFRPRIALRDIPKRLTMLLSGTDNRRNHSDEVEALQSRARDYAQRQSDQMDDWDRALHREWVSLVSRNALISPYSLTEPSESSKVKHRRSRQRRSVATRDISPQPRVGVGSDSRISSPRRQWTSQLGRYNPREQRVLGHYGEGFSHILGNPVSNPHPMEGNTEDGTTTSGSTQTTIASRTWNSDTLPRGTVLRRDRVTGRTRMVVTGEFIPEEENPRISTINVGTLKATTSDEDKYCMLDSGANVMVVPLMRDMRGDRTMCSLVGDNKTQGLIISRLYTETRSYLVVAVENASVLLPPAYLVRIAGYRLAWENVPGGEYFKLQDGYGEPVAVQEDDDLLFLGKNTLWRVGHDMYRFAHRQTGMTWPEIWEQLTGESLTIQAITTTSTDQSVDFVELFNPGNFKEQKSSLVAGGTYDVRVNPAIDLTRDSVRQQVRKDIEKEDPLILLGAPPCTVFSPMQNINQKHHIGEAWEKKKQDGMDLLLFATQCYWDQIERGMFFLHEHPATASSWGLNALQELEAYPGVHVVTADMCRWGMRVRDEIPEDQGQPYLVKKPTKWMTNCKPLAELLSLRCDGTHSHVRLEGGTLTRRAASYPISLVRDILKVVVKVKQLAKTANYPKDPAHVMIPESLQESEHCVQVAYTQNTLQAYDTRTPRAIPWESVVVRRTINRKTGVVMAEDYTEELTEVTINRPFKGHSPKEVLTVFFYWDPERTDHMVNYIACSLDLEMYLSITSELLNVLLNDPHLVPRSSYRKAIGEGVRTITYGAHTSLAALQKSHKFVTNITTADNHQRVLLLCHKLATLMPRSIPYLCITVVVLTTGEDLAPHRDIQNHRHFRNATISFGKWEGGVLQTYEDDIWVNQDSRDQWVILDARNTFHRVTSVEGDRVSVIYHTPQHLDRLRQDDWDILRDTGFPVDQLWEGGLLKELSDAEDDDCPQEQIMTVRQTTPAFSENEFYAAEDLDLDANSVFRPTLQAVLWLSELIATTTLRKETVTKRGPKSDDVVTMRAMHDIVAQAQVVLENESDLVTVIVVMTRILILVISLVVKLGAQYHMGLVLLQFLAKNIWDPKEIGDADTEVVSVITAIPTRSVWQWIPNMYWLRRLSRNSDSD